MKYQIATKNILGLPIRKGESYRIIGAGVSGLLLGYYMKKNGIPFQIYEKGTSPGGLIKTLRLEGLGLAEQAANGFVWCEEIADICQDLGLEIQSADETSKARYLVRNNELRKYPLGVFETLGVASKFLLPHSKKLETVEDFGRTYFGDTFTDQILEPAFAGIYGAPISKLSFSAVLKPFAEQLNDTNFLPKAIYRWRKQAKKSTTHKKLSGTQSFKGGFGIFPIRLAEYLKDHIHYNETLSNIQDQATILTVPAHISQQFFEGRMNELLNQVSYTPIITTTLFFKKEDVNRFKAGFGCLIPSNEKTIIQGVLFNSCIFPDRVEQEDLMSLTCIFRDYERNYINKTDKEILETALLPDLRKLLGIGTQPEGFKVFRWEKGIPLYDNKLGESWIEMEQLLKQDYPNVRLLGNYTGQVSVRGMAQFIAKAF